MFKELCGPEQICIGFRKNEAGTGIVGTGLPDILSSVPGVEPKNDGEPEEVAADPYLLWLIAPSPDGRYAAVEFAEADAATFVYKTGGDFDRFARQLNRALEAIGFKREVIRLTDSELKRPENADYYMAAKRTTSLKFVRANFAGRVIHSGTDVWKRKLTELWSADPSVQLHSPTVQTAASFCAGCGAALTPGVKFCGACGGKV